MVVSPLVSLAEDQTDKLELRRVPALRVDSTLNAGEHREALRGVASGKLDLVYVTPSAWKTRNSSSCSPVRASRCSWSTRHTAKELALRQPLIVRRSAERKNLHLAVAHTGAAHATTESDPDAHPDAGKLARVIDLIKQEPGSGLVYTATIKSARSVW